MRFKVNKIHSLSVLIFIIVFLFSYRSNPLYQMLRKLLSVKPNELLKLGRNAVLGVKYYNVYY